MGSAKNRSFFLKRGVLSDTAPRLPNLHNGPLSRFGVTRDWAKTAKSYRLEGKAPLKRSELPNCRKYRPSRGQSAMILNRFRGQKPFSSSLWSIPNLRSRLLFTQWTYPGHSHSPYPLPGIRAIKN